MQGEDFLNLPFVRKVFSERIQSLTNLYLAAMVPENAALKEPGYTPHFPPAARLAARVVSYLFHPLFIPLLVGWFFIYEIRLFPQNSAWDNKKLMIMFVLYYTFFPLVVTLLLKALHFIDSIQLKSRRDRIIPYVACEIFYFWGWYVFKNSHFDKLVVMFGLAVFLACSAGLILNAYMKISMHAISVGVLCTIVFLTAMVTNINLGAHISIALLIGGLTATARLMDSDHHPVEVYFGFFTGVAAQLIAYWFV